MPVKLSRRWAIFCIACMLFILSQFYRATVAVITPNLITDVGIDAKGLSMISAAFFYAFAVMQIPISLYLDSIGPRVSMTVLTLAAVPGALIFAWSDTLVGLVAGRILLGVGMSCNFMGTLKLITLWFGPQRFATLAALVASVGTLGNIGAATPLVLMVDVIGWRMTFTVFAVFNLVIAMVFFLVVRDCPQGLKSQAVSHKSAADFKQTAAGVKALFMQKDYWIISLGTFCRYGIYAAVQALWAGPYLMNLMGIAPISAGNILFLMSMGLVIGSPICGSLSDGAVHSRKKVVVAGLGGMIVILVILAFLQPGVSTVTLALLFFSFGFCSSAGQVMYAHIKERMPLERAGTAMTGINFFTMGGVAVFLQGLGYLMQRLYPAASFSAPAFRSAFGLCAVCLAATAILYLFTRETLSKQNQ